jgi:hypothetical protein
MNTKRYQGSGENMLGRIASKLLAAFFAVLLVATQAKAYVIEVITVPATGVNENIPHFEYNGHAIVLKAIIRVYGTGANGVTSVHYKWDTNANGNLTEEAEIQNTSYSTLDDTNGYREFRNCALVVNFPDVTGTQAQPKNFQIQVTKVNNAAYASHSETVSYPTGQSAIYTDVLTASYNTLIDPTVPKQTGLTSTLLYTGSNLGAGKYIGASGTTYAETEGALLLDDIIKDGLTQYDQWTAVPAVQFDLPASG